MCAIIKIILGAAVVAVNTLLRDPVVNIPRNLIIKHYFFILLLYFFLHNRGIIAKGYKNIRQTIVNLVVNTLFDPIGIRQYFSSRKKGMRPMLHLGQLQKINVFYDDHAWFLRYCMRSNMVCCVFTAETHFASLLDSEVANRIIEMKIESALKRPEGKKNYLQIKIYVHAIISLY